MFIKYCKVKVQEIFDIRCSEYALSLDTGKKGLLYFLIVDKTIMTEKRKKTAPPTENQNESKQEPPTQFD